VLILFAAWYLAAPPLLAMALAAVVIHRVRASAAPAPEAVRRHGRLLIVPWLLYLANLFAAAMYLGGGGLAWLAHRVGGALIAGVGLAAALLPTLLVSLVMRSCERRVGHPAGFVSAGVHARSWLVYVGSLAFILGVTGSVMSLLGPVAAVVGVGLVIVAFSVLYPWIAMWIWRATPLGEDDDGHRIRSLLGRYDMAFRHIAVMPAAHAPTANAFVSGVWPRMQWLFLTEPLLQYAPDEIAGVVAHEMGHLRGHHVLRMSLAFVGTDVVVFWALFTFVPAGAAPRAPLSGLTAFLATLASLIVVRRLSRRLELEADDFAASLLGSGAPLAAALRKLARENWLPGGNEGGGMFASHPAVGRRLARLEAATR
jgi:Zn-dependent protease with chaperone function